MPKPTRSRIDPEEKVSGFSAFERFLIFLVGLVLVGGAFVVVAGDLGVQTPH